MLPFFFYLSCLTDYNLYYFVILFNDDQHLFKGRRGRNRIVVGFTTTCAISA
jgi:hypothetical protein